MTNRNLLILGALGIIVLMVAYYFLLMSPLLGRLQEQSQARKDKQAQLAQVQQDVNELEEVRRNSPEIERQLLELSKRIPAQPQIPTFVVQDEEIATASGVTQLTVDPEPAGSPEGGGDYQVVPVTMQFQGTYDEMQDFLLRTRNLARLVTVTKITYCRSQGDTAGTAGDTESSITCPTATTTEGEGEVTTLNPSAETLLDVEIEADIYFQPTDATSGAAPPTVVPETTTPEQPAETTSGG